MSDAYDPHKTLPTDPLVGGIVAGRYRVLRRLGEGGMGVVYEAEHTTIRRRVALKTLHSHLARNPDLVARFHREALAATQIGNEHIVEALDMGQLPDGTAYLVLEFLEGREFAKLIEEESPLPVDRVCRIMVQLCEALQAAHDKGIVHRDLKPENVMLLRRSGNEDFVKLLDFGISKFLDSATGPGGMTRTGTTMGTAFYMSPEQLAGDRHVDHRTDLWALGVILFEALTTRFPFDGETMALLSVKILTADPIDIRAYRPELPPELVDVLRRLLLRDKEKRPRDCNELAGLLRPYTQPGVSFAVPDAFAAESLAMAKTTPPIGSPMAPRSAPPEPIPTPAPGPPLATTFGSPITVVTPLAAETPSAALPPPVATIPAEALNAPPAAPAAVSAPPASVPNITSVALQAEVDRTQKPARSSASLLLGGAGLLVLAAGALAVVRPWASPSAGAPPPVTAVEHPDAARVALAPPPAPPAVDAAQGTSAVPLPPPTAHPIHVVIRSVPRGATLKLDGVPYPNPFDGELQASSRLRRLEVSLARYRTLVQEVVLEVPQTVELTLQRGSGGALLRRIDGTVTELPAAPSAPPSSAPPPAPAAPANTPPAPAPPPPPPPPAPRPPAPVLPQLPAIQDPV